MATLPALVTGHKAGINKAVKNNKKKKEYPQLNARTDVYTEMYFVPAEKFGLEVLRHTITNSRVERYIAIERYIETYRPEVGLRKDALLPYGRSYNHFELAYLPVFDIKFIAWLRGWNERVMVATYKEATTAISKSLGLKIIGGFDFHLNENGGNDKLDLKRYGNDGRLIKK